MPGRMYPCRAEGGKGRSIWHVWDERNVDLSGNVTWMGWCRVVFVLTFAVGVW